MRGRSAGSWAGLVALGAAAALALPAGASAAKLEQCEKRSSLLCGSVAVPLDRTGAVAGRVELSVMRLPASKGPRAGTLMVLAGGPGESATGALAIAALTLGKAAARFDLVAFDQRGTGKSGKLRCRALRKSGSRSLSAAFARCAKQLGPRRAFFRTADSIDDVEAVRRYLGGPTLSLLAVSYGARVAGEYVRRYPASVGRLVLDSPVPLTGTDPFDRQVQTALPRVLSSLCEKACRFTASPYGDLTRLARRLDRRPLRGKVIDDRGRARRTALSGRALHRVVAATDVDPGLRGQLPAAVASALKGDPALLLRLAAVASKGSVGGLSVPLTAATLCSESQLPWDPAAPPGPHRRAAVRAALAQLGTAPFAPFAPRAVVADGLLAICTGWPAVPNKPAPVAGAAAVPTLILSGTEDLRTPLEQANAIASGYSAATVLAVPHTGHSVIGSAPRSCATRALIRFLRGEPAPAACPSRPRPKQMAAAAPPPVRLAAVPGRTRVQRLRRVAKLTARDVFGQLLIAPTRRFGGLRGGTAVVERRRLVLDGYEYVRGVEVSGRLRPGRRGGLRGTVSVRAGDAAPVRVEL
jgi:pimeloyl-ACP methyl ester carboxylesterase